MLNENIRNLRKSTGMSQEELAAKLNVVRQTISKWEKGLSVPDSEMLIKIADVFEVSVSQLLGSDIPVEKESINEIAEQLQRINEQMAIKYKRTKTIIKVVAGVIVGIILFNITLIILGSVTFDGIKTHTEETHTEIISEHEESSAD